MKITIERVPEYTLAEFADLHNLEMYVKERVFCNEFNRFYAYFHNCEVKRGNSFADVVGNGRTPEEAIADYAVRINLKSLIYDDAVTKRDLGIFRLKREE